MIDLKFVIHVLKLLTSISLQIRTVYGVLFFILEGLAGLARLAVRDSGVEGWILSEAHAIFTACKVRSYLNIIVRIIHFNVSIKLLLLIFDHEVAHGSAANNEEASAADSNSNNGASA